MTEVIPGVYQLKLPLPTLDVLMGYVNVYVVRGDKGCLLIDAGLNTSGAFRSFKEQLAEIGLDIEDITQIVVTHIHPDHYGLVGRLKDLHPSARFYLHQMERDMVNSRYINVDDLLQQISRWLHSNGVPEAELPELQTASLGLARFVAHTLPDVTLSGGETIIAGSFTFQAIWTPGHSPGHIVLYEPRRKILFTGDHILPTITPNIGLHPQSTGNPLGDYIRSLNAVKQLDVDLVLPGHENPFTGLSARVDEIIEHHIQRNSEILSAIKAGASTGYQIARQITWLKDIGGAGYQDLSLLDKRLAVLETLAHLELMRAEGRVAKFSKNSFICYKLTG